MGSGGYIYVYGADLDRAHHNAVSSMKVRECRPANH